MEYILSEKEEECIFCNALAKSDDHVNGARLEQSTGNLFNLFSVSYHVMLPWPYL